MALHYINDDGTIRWHCHRKNCKPRAGHIDDDDIEWVDASTISLPPCGCGSRTQVKIKFTDEELQAPNMLEYGMVPTEMTVPHALTGEPVPVLIPAFKPIGVNPFIARHQALAEQLEARGKRFCPPKDAKEIEAKVKEGQAKE